MRDGVYRRHSLQHWGRLPSTCPALPYLCLPCKPASRPRVGTLVIVPSPPLFFLPVRNMRGERKGKRKRKRKREREKEKGNEYE